MIDTTDPEVEAVLAKEMEQWELLWDARTQMRVGLRLRLKLTIEEMTERFNRLNDAQERYKEFSKTLWF